MCREDVVVNVTVDPKRRATLKATSQSTATNQLTKADLALI